MTDRFLLLLLIAGCLLFGAIIVMQLEFAAPDEAAVAGVVTRPDVAAPMHRQQNPRLDELVATTLARPLFTNTRRPPQSGSPEAATDSDLADTRLTGIVTEPGRRIAIFAVNGNKPLKLAEGEAVSGWRIESITPREVSLSGPTGTKILEPKFDPNLAPGQPAAGSAGARVPPSPTAVGARLPVPPAPSVSASAPGPLPRAPRVRQQR